MFSRFDSDHLSLRDISNDIDDKFGYDISKQSLNDRFNEKTVDFLKLLIADSLERKFKESYPSDFLNQFSSVLIQDSTSFQLPSSLVKYYDGGGGNSTGSIIRIQFEYDMKQGRITQLEITPGSLHDVVYAKNNIDKVKKNDLIIRDLGYVCNGISEQIIANSAFFLNRLRSFQTAYIMNKHDHFEKLNFSQLYDRIKKNNLSCKEIEIYLGEKKQIKVRLIVELVPEDVYQKRIHKAGIKAKKNKRQLSNEYKSRARMNIFITNVPATIIPLEKVRLVYSLRWQIELIFKSWKSIIGIARIKKVKKERFESQLLARLLLIIVTWQIFNVINSHVQKLCNMNPISYQKFNKIIRNRLESLSFAIISGKRLVKEYMNSLLRICLKKTHEIEAKKGKMSSIHTLKGLDQIPVYMESLKIIIA